MKVSINPGAVLRVAVLLATCSLAFPFGTIAQTSAPVASFWNDSAQPAFVTGNDARSVELGMKFSSSVDGLITAIRYYKATNSPGTHTGTIWTSTGTKLASVTFMNETAFGWQTQQLATPLAISAGTRYVVSYHTAEYPWTTSFFTQSLTVGALTASANAGVYAYGAGVRFPTRTWISSNYWVDVAFQSGTATAPSITGQPANRTATVGQTATFSVTVSGTTPMTYQWMKNGATISGATSSSYTTPATTTSDDGTQFNVVVGNTVGSVTSGAATLTVNASTMAPSITSQPASRTVTAGQTATFSVTASGTTPLTYQWMENGAAIGGATSPSYTTSVTTTSDTGAQFGVIVGNTVGSVTSSAATLTVNASTMLLSVNPSSLSFGSVNVGSTGSQQATLTNSGTGNVTLSGLSISGAGFRASGVSSGQVLTPGQTATINASFQPAVAGSATGAVTVTSNASAPVVVALSGSAVQPVSHTVTLTWTPSITPTVNGYFVYNSQVSGGPYSKLTASAVSPTGYSDASVQSGKTYYYVVTAVDASGLESAYSIQATAAIP